MTNYNDRIAYPGYFTERELNVIDTALLKYKFFLFDKKESASDYNEVSAIESRFNTAIARIIRNDFDRGDNI